MKARLLALLLAASVALSACDNSHVSANVPAKDDFRPFLLRDLITYFHAYGKTTLDYELLRDEPTQAGVANPKYYVWVTVTYPDKSIVDGAARVAAEQKQRFRVTNFVPRSDIAADPTQIRIFPEALREKIKKKAGVKQ